MIDFRYHLISIVAVFLALGMGILMGSGLLADPLRKNLEGRVREVIASNGRLRSTVEELRVHIDDQVEFARAAERHLLAGTLARQSLVVFTFDDSDGALLDAITESAEIAGASVASTITFSNKLALSTPAEVDQLALALGSTSGDPDALREEVAREIASLAVRARNVRPQESRGSGAVAFALEDLLRDLEGAEFVGVGVEASETVPRDSAFLVVGGNDESSAYTVGAFVLDLASALADEGAPVVVAEHSDSVWGLVPSVRGDLQASTSVSTVDSAETVSGRVALLLGVARAVEGSPSHLGFGPGAEEVLPEPSPSP